MRLRLELSEPVFLRWLNAQAPKSGLWDDSRLTDMLRSHVDTFLASGIKTSGAEERLSRSLPMGSEARDVLLKWTENHHGALSWHPEKGFEFDTWMGLDEWSGNEDLGSRTEIEAARQFACFMDSEARWRLVKCKRCQVYVLPKTLRRKVHEKGWHCAQCAHKRSAIDSTSSRRKRDKERIRQALAKAVEDWQKMAHKPRLNRVLWITEKVNDLLDKYGVKIARNTTTRYLNETESVDPLKR